MQEEQGSLSDMAAELKSKMEVASTSMYFVSQVPPKSTINLQYTSRKECYKQVIMQMSAVMILEWNCRQKPKRP